MSHRKSVVRVILVIVVLANLISGLPALAEDSGSDPSPTLESADAPSGGTTAAAEKASDE